MEEASKRLSLLQRAERGGDRADEWDRVGVDGEIVVQSVVEEREEVRDIGVNLKKTV